jgi:hypothetical protein
MELKFGKSKLVPVIRADEFKAVSLIKRGVIVTKGFVKIDAN